MAKITIDENACVGCGLCVNSCPDCFEMGEDGIAKVKSSECPSCDLNEVASQCPVNAITVEA
ncbi:MAG: ferredoxin [Candidatus Omnitrophota bacterium]|nr:MAG: ferredoxin [Candidatus Omnitrophota bacterium]RKY45787.1 MAG: ferredoxin [Candidatus Omnitrophota bacterium]HDN85597.1 ferredoxin [Candidatus Omnitrophota bacterium]